MGSPPRPPALRGGGGAGRRRPLWATLLLTGAAGLASLSHMARGQETTTNGGHYGSNPYDARMGGGRAFARTKAMASDGFGATYVLGKADQSFCMGNKGPECPDRPSCIKGSRGRRMC